MLAAVLALGPLEAWLLFDGPGLLAAGSAYSTLLAVVAGRRLWRGTHPTAAGVLVAAAALMIPFTVHGLEHTIGFFPYAFTPPRHLGELVNHPTFLVHASAILALAVAAARFPFPPLVALLTGAAWILAMDAAPLVFGPEVSWSQRALLSATLGAFTTAWGVLLDGRTRGDYAHWLYAAGLLLLCGGVVSSRAASWPAVVLHIEVDLFLLVVALLIRRRIFAVFGALALATGAGRLASEVVAGPALVAVALAIGCAAIAGAATFGRLERRVSGPLRALLPSALRRLLPPPPVA